MALEVRFTLTDPDDQPLSQVEARVVCGAAAGWQDAAAGERFTTDARGEHRFTTSAPLERRSRKQPTNFVDSVFSRAQPTDFLQVATELEHAGHRRLYVIELHRFRDGTVLQENFSVFTRDGEGAFTARAQRHDQAWKIADLGGWLTTNPGHEVWNAMLEPDAFEPAGDRWILTLAFKRWPAPVIR